MNIYVGRDGRSRCYVDGKVVSYPKFIMEQHLGRKLIEPETVDHIDGNPLNNELSNLRILSRSENARLGALGNKHCVGYKQSEEHKRSGEKNGMAKLTKEEVDYYRMMYRIKSLSKLEIMIETNLSRRAVENFLNGVSYK